MLASSSLHSMAASAARAFARLYDPTVNHSDQDKMNEISKLYHQYSAVLKNPAEVNDNDDAYVSPPPILQDPLPATNRQKKNRAKIANEVKEMCDQYSTELLPTTKRRKKKKKKNLAKIAEVKSVEEQPSREDNDNDDVYAFPFSTLYDGTSEWFSSNDPPLSINHNAVQKGINVKAAVQKTDIQKTDIQKTDIQGTDIQGTDIQGTDIQGTDIQGTDIQGTDISKVFEVIDKILQQQQPSDIPSRILVVGRKKLKRNYRKQISQLSLTHGSVQYTRLNKKGEIIQMKKATATATSTIVVLGTSGRMAKYLSILSQFPILAIVVHDALQYTYDVFGIPELVEFLNSGPEVCPHLYLLDVIRNAQIPLSKTEAQQAKLQFWQTLKYTAVTIM